MCDRGSTTTTGPVVEALLRALLPPLCLLAGLLTPRGALAAPDVPAPDVPAPDVAPFALGVSAGYAFRPDEDGRSHGGAAELYADVPIFGPFAARASGFGLGFGATADVQAGLGLTGLGLSLVYALDETDVVALFEAGPFVGLGGEIGEATEPPALYAGALLGLGLRFALTEVFRVEAAVRLPYVAWGPAGVALPPPVGEDREVLFPLQVTATLGLVIAPGALVEAALAGRDPLSLLVPAL